MMQETDYMLSLGWTLDETQQGLKKTFKMKSYDKALVSQSAPFHTSADIWSGLDPRDWDRDETKKPSS